MTPTSPGSTATGGNACATRVRLCERASAGTPWGPALRPLPLEPHRALRPEGARRVRREPPSSPESDRWPEHRPRAGAQHPVSSPYFFAGREPELRALIRQPARGPLDRQLRRAACRGMDPDAFHPDEGRPDDPVLAPCTGCSARLACLALALRTEEPDSRCGWYGGLGPEDRDDAASALGLATPEASVTDRAVQAARLRASGLTVEAVATELGCSRRTVQRYLRIAA